MRSRTLVRHTACVAAYFCYEIVMLYAFTGEMVFFWDVFWHLWVNLSLFYINAHVVLDTASKQQTPLKQYLTGATLIGLELLSFLAVKYLLAQAYIHYNVETTRPYEDFLNFFRDTLYRFITVSGLSFGYWFASRSITKQKEVSKLEKQRLQDLLTVEQGKTELIALENDLLKSKINFHFLFNTLNFLHDTVKDTSEDAGDAIIGLSDILHYTLGTPSGGKVRLADELRYVKAVFKISKLKAGGNLAVDFSISGWPGNLLIIPMVLITFCENVLKYADLNDPHFPARFRCSLSNETLEVHIVNKKTHVLPSISYGIGMKNTEKRLDIAYPDKYTLIVQDSPEIYQLHLILQLS